MNRWRRRKGRKDVPSPVSVRLRHRRPGFAGAHFWSDKHKNMLLVVVENNDVVKMAAELDGNINLAEVDGGSELLHRACQAGSYDITSVLLQHGADVNTSRAGYHPLHIVVKTNHSALASLLLEHGADINAASFSESRSPLHLAAIMGQHDVGTILLEKNADVNQADIYGAVPLHAACHLGHTGIVRTLLNNNAEINACDNEGWTGLHLASEAGHLEVVQMLIQCHAHLNSQNKYGRTSLHWAVISERVEVVQLLLMTGANSNIVDLHDKKAIDYSANFAIRRLLQNSQHNSVITTVPSLHDYRNRRVSRISSGVDIVELIPEEDLASFRKKRPSDAAESYGPRDDAKLGSGQFGNAVENVNRHITVVERNVRNMMASISALQDIGLKSLSPDFFKDMHNIVQRTKRIASDFKQEFQFELSRLSTMFEEHLIQLGSNLSQQSTLRPEIYCRFVLSAGRNLASDRFALLDLSNDAQDAEQQTHTGSNSELAENEVVASCKAIVKVLGKAYNLQVPGMKYTIDFLQKHQIDDSRITTILADTLGLSMNSEALALDVQTIISVADNLGEDGRKLADFLGMDSADDDRRVSVYGANVRILEKLDSRMEVSGEDKRLSLSRGLVEIGREDVLTVLIKPAEFGTTQEGLDDDI